MLNTYHLDALYLCEQGCGETVIIFQSQTGSLSKEAWGTLAYMNGEAVGECISCTCLLYKAGLHAGT